MGAASDSGAHPHFLVVCLIFLLVCWLVGCSLVFCCCCFVGFIGWLTAWWSVGLLADCLVWSVGWLTAWLVGRSVGWLAGWSCCDFDLLHLLVCRPEILPIAAFVLIAYVPNGFIIAGVIAVLSSFCLQFEVCVCVCVCVCGQRDLSCIP